MQCLFVTRLYAVFMSHHYAVFVSLSRLYAVFVTHLLCQSGIFGDTTPFELPMFPQVTSDS